MYIVYEFAGLYLIIRLTRTSQLRLFINFFFIIIVIFLHFLFLLYPEITVIIKI